MAGSRGSESRSARSPTGAPGWRDWRYGRSRRIHRRRWRRGWRRGASSGPSVLLHQLLQFLHVFGIERLPPAERRLVGNAIRVGVVGLTHTERIVGDVAQLE